MSGEVAVPIPVDVSGLSAGVTALGTSIDHTCAVTARGGVKCWGLNDQGQLGNNSTASAAAPVDVSGLASGISQIAAGFSHTCALTSAGGVKCWGDNASGQLGNDSDVGSRVPVDVVGLSSGVSAISAGRYHSCAAMNAGGMKCWGGNAYGELGNGSTLASRVPTDVTGLQARVSTVSAGDNVTCALTTTGAGWCWGNNRYGQLGNNAGGQVGDESHIPVAVQGLSVGATSIAVGYGYACAVASGGAVMCWGHNSSGEIGNNSDWGFETPVPVGVTGLDSGGAHISAGSSHACAVTSGGAVKCWGSNSGGELGNDTTTDSKVPVNVVSFP